MPRLHTLASRPPFSVEGSASAGSVDQASIIGRSVFAKQNTGERGIVFSTPRSATRGLLGGNLDLAMDWLDGVGLNQWALHDAMPQRFGRAMFCENLRQVLCFLGK